MFFKTLCLKLVDFFALLFMILNVSQFLMLNSNNFKILNCLKKTERHFFLEKATKRPRNINHCISKGNKTRRLLPLCGSKKNFGSRVNRSRLPIFADETQKGSFVCKNWQSRPVKNPRLPKFFLLPHKGNN